MSALLRSEQVASFWQSHADDDEVEEIDQWVDCNYIKNKSAQHYILLGPMDSGTNLIHQLMYTAWPSKVCMASKSIVWKHALTGVDDLYKFMLNYTDQAAIRNSVVLHTTRTPIAQLDSWSKNPYELEECVNRPVHHWVKPCVANMGPYHPRLGPHDYIGGTKPTQYNSTMEVYNRYLQQLVEFRESGWFKAVVPVSYEDMLLSPGRLLNDIAKHFDGLGEVDVAELHKSLQEPAKDNAETLDEAVQAFKERAYLDDFSPSELKTMCKGLNKALVKQFKAGNYLANSDQVSYWDDCSRHV